MKRIAFILLALVVAVPALADIGHDITLPIAGRVELPAVTYDTELVIRNHGDVEQVVVLDLIGGQHPGGRPFQHDGTILLGPRQTRFFPNGLVPRNTGTLVYAMRIWATKRQGNELLFVPDPEARIEAVAYIVGERGRFGYLGTSRQEIQATASTEYFAKETVFHGIRHDGLAYTNVGITNMHETQEQTFVVEFYNEPAVHVVVPPRSLRSIRLPGTGNDRRSVTITPMWALDGGTPAPWVAYASTVDTQTGDAYSGIRSLATENVTP